MQPITARIQSHARIRRLGLLTGAAVLIALAAAPFATAQAEPLEGEGCAVTPGGWGAPPAGNNPGSLLHDNFDDLFGDELVVGNLVFDDAQEVTDALPYSGQGGAFKSHSVALALNIAFGDAGLLDGTVSDVTAVSTNLTLNGKTAVEILAMAEAILNSDSDIRNNEYSDLVNAMTGFNEETFGCHAPPMCPAGLVALAQSDGSITLTWTAVAGAEEYHVYRATGTGPFLHLDSVDGLTYTDSTTAVGQTYSYKVTADDGTLESRGCEAVTATAVPFFGGIVATSLAALGAVGAFVAFRRRG